MVDIILSQQISVSANHVCFFENIRQFCRWFAVFFLKFEDVFFLWDRSQSNQVCGCPARQNHRRMTPASMVPYLMGCGLRLPTRDVIRSNGNRRNILTHLKIQPTTVSSLKGIDPQSCKFCWVPSGRLRSFVRLFWPKPNQKGLKLYIYTHIYIYMYIYMYMFYLWSDRSWT